MINTRPTYKKFPRETNGNQCLFCENICPDKVVIYYDLNRDTDPKTFIGKKLICAKHDKKISRDYKKAKKKLLAGFEYYRDLVYGVQLMLLRFQAASCKHVENTDLLKKRLIAIFQDYDNLVLQKENKEK